MTINLFLGFDIRDRQALAAFLNDSRARLATQKIEEEEEEEQEFAAR
jgi:hypothetical protein